MPTSFRDPSRRWKPPPGLRTRRSAAASRIQSAFRSKSAYRKVKAVKKIASKVIDLKKETHHKVLLDPRTQYNNAPNDANDLRPVLPSIIQGGQTITTGNNRMTSNIESREGNKVHLQSIRIKGLITIPSDDLPESDDRGLVCCRLLAFSCDKYKTYESMKANWVAGDQLKNSLLRRGAHSIAYDGTMSGIWLPVNTELFTIHYDKTFYLNRGQRQQIGSSVNDGIGAYHMPNVYRAFSINLRVKKKLLTYKDPESVQPTNYGPAVILMFAYCNGAASSSAAVPFMQFNSTARWKDE